MSVAGNKRTLYFGTQSAKGTPQDTPTVAFRVSDFTPNPVRQTITLAESDRTTQQGIDVVVANTPGFSFKCYLRPQQAAFLMQALLGDDTDTGSTPNYTHTIAAAEDTPYLTMFEEEPDVWCNKHTDIRVTQIEFTAQSGGAAEATITCEALGFTAGATAPTSPDQGSDLPYVWPEVQVKRAGAHPGTASQFQITIARNGQRLNTDTGFNSLDYVNGLFAISGQFTKYASDDDDRRRVDTGSTTGTTPTTAIPTETLELLITRDANTSLSILIAAASYPTNVAAVNTDGSPLAEVVGFRSNPQTDLADHVTVVAKDQLATPDG